MGISAWSTKIWAQAAASTTGPVTHDQLAEVEGSILKALDKLAAAIELNKPATEEEKKS